MKPRKEHYRGKLPHFQQPGQWYSITFTLTGAMPKREMDRYSLNLENARYRLEELRKQQPEDRLSRVSDFPKSDKYFDLGKSKILWGRTIKSFATAFFVSATFVNLAASQNGTCFST